MGLGFPEAPAKRKSSPLQEQASRGRASSYSVIAELAERAGFDFRPQAKRSKAFSKYCYKECCASGADTSRPAAPFVTGGDFVAIVSALVVKVRQLKSSFEVDAG